jgi:hypothetical protein
VSWSIVISWSCIDYAPSSDARKCDTGFYETVLDVDRLDRIRCEVPPGSCAVMAYTANTWRKNTTLNMSFNVKWVMILGVPGAASQGSYQ